VRRVAGTFPGMAATPAHAERGFTLIEVTIAVALFAAVMLVTLDLVRGAFGGMQHLQTQAAAANELDVFVERLRSESRTALALTVLQPTCHSVAFVARDSTSAFHYWLYHWDGARVMRYASETAPLSPCPTASGDVLLTGITRFDVTVFTANQLAAHVDPISQNPDTPFLVAGAAPTVAVPLGVNDADGTTPIAGGNALTELVIEGAATSRVVDLIAGTNPSAYTAVLNYTCNARQCDGAFPAGVDIQNCTWTSALDASPAPVPIARSANGNVSGWFVDVGFTFTYLDRNAQPSYVVQDDAGATVDVPNSASIAAAVANNTANAPESPTFFSGIGLTGSAPQIEAARCDAIAEANAAGAFYGN
jgi:prepilin-type N-terminal cleavage/methylation domain-containing protein